MSPPPEPAHSFHPWKRNLVGQHRQNRDACEQQHNDLRLLHISKTVGVMEYWANDYSITPSLHYFAAGFARVRFA